MRRILLLIVLVMLAKAFLQHRADRPRPGRDGEVLKGTFLRMKWDDSAQDYAYEDLSLPRKAERSELGSEVDRASRKFSSQLMATEERAKADAIHQLEGELSEWLAPEVPDSWKPPKILVQSMIRDVAYQPVVKDYGTLYIAELSADTSARRREAIVAAYHRETVHHRMMALGGSLAFVLVCLGIVSGYIRADEATKGYYTNRLRMLAAAGVGAAGMAVYRFMA